jgi:hypothetical protein
VKRYSHENDSSLNYVLNIEHPFTEPVNFKIDFNNIYGLCLAYNKITPDFVSRCHHHNEKVMTYSCNISKRILRAFELKMDVIMTDAPGVVMDSFMLYKKEY